MMYFSNEFLQTALLLGVVQGIISSVLLWRSGSTFPPSRLMAVLALLISLACLNTYFFHAAWFQRSVFLGVLHAVIPLVIVMPVGPLLYMYVRQVTIPARAFTPADRLHFLPVIIDLVPYLVALIYIGGSALHFFTSGPVAWSDFIDTYNSFSDLPRWLSITIYLALAWRLAKHPFAWVKALLTGFSIFQLIWLLYLLPYLWPGYNIRLLQTVGWYPVMVPLVILVYWTGINAWLFGRAQPGKQQKTLSIATAKASLALLERSMQNNQLYLDPKLQVEKVAALTGLSAKTISATVNQYLGQSFNQWVNSYRVEAFKRRLAAGNQSHLTLAGIARECGFNSPTSFQRVFKQLTGTVPTEYRDRLVLTKDHPNQDLDAERLLS